MSRVETIGSATLYLGDCREVLPMLGGVDTVVTDPPYGIKFSEYESHNDDPATYHALMRAVVPLAESKVENGWCVFFQGSKRAHEWQEIIPRPWRVMACAKSFTQILPGAGPLWSTDYALFWPIGKPRQNGKGRDYHVAITSYRSTRPKGHPCPRPIDQMKYVVECFSDSGDMLLDPFMGSGTTGVACIKLGRKFVGIEIEPKYFDMACRRIDEATRQPDMFIEPAPAYYEQATLALPE